MLNLAALSFLHVSSSAAFWGGVVLQKLGLVRSARGGWSVCVCVPLSHFPKRLCQQIWFPHIDFGKLENGLAGLVKDHEGYPTDRPVVGDRGGSRCVSQSPMFAPPMSKLSRDSSCRCDGIIGTGVLFRKRESTV